MAVVTPLPDATGLWLGQLHAAAAAEARLTRSGLPHPLRMRVRLLPLALIRVLVEVLAVLATQPATGTSLHDRSPAVDAVAEADIGAHVVSCYVMAWHGPWRMDDG